MVFPAYIDLGTGSYVLQVVMASLLGGVFLLRIFWRKIIFTIRSVFKNSETEEADSDHVD